MTAPEKEIPCDLEEMAIFDRPRIPDEVFNLGFPEQEGCQEPPCGPPAE